MTNQRETAQIHGVPFPGLSAAVTQIAKAQGLEVQQDTGSLRVQTMLGTLGFQDQGDTIALSVEADTAEALFTLKEGVVLQLQNGLSRAAGRLVWDSTGNAGALPPNFRILRTVSVTQISQDFLRVRVTGSDLHAFAGERLHFRLALPPDDSPDWPVLDDSGSTKWPEGDRALHRPVYTTVWSDPDQGLLDFDVFIHDGGRITEWARSVEPGAEIGISGPGGATLHAAPQMVLAGDETAYPAITRQLAHVAGRATGRVALLTSGAKDYPITVPDGFTLDWIERDGGTTLSDWIAGHVSSDWPGFLWAACEKSEAIPLRAKYRGDWGWQRDRSYIAAFWTA